MLSPDRIIRANEAHQTFFQDHASPELYSEAEFEDPPYEEIYIREQVYTQMALQSLGVLEAGRISDIDRVGTIRMHPEMIEGLRTPYAVEVLGMPRAGKTTMLRRYLRELRRRKERNKVALNVEGARSVKDEYGDLRYSDPLRYSELGGMQNFLGYMLAIRKMNEGMHMVASDRGQYDRRVFRRALFLQGKVDPKIMEDEELYIYAFENVPIQMGGVIMMMIPPDETMRRSKKEGPVANMDFLPLLYEQYWRLHQEALNDDLPYRFYECIDATQPKEAVYKQFKYAMDSILNLRETYMQALQAAFPEEFHRAMLELAMRRRVYDQTAFERELSIHFGGRVKIVGGDDMMDERDIMKKPFLQVIRDKQ